MEEFHRIRRLPPYVFEQVNRAKARGTQCGRRHHRPRHGQSGPAGAGACHREAQGDDRQAAHRPLFGLEGHRGPAPRAGRLLRPPLRREAQSGHPDRRHARLQGRLRQRGAGDHRAGRRHPGAQPELPDPRLRLPDGGRRDPLGAVRADAAISSRRSSARSCIRSRSRSRWWSAIRRIPTAYVADLDFYKELVPFAKKHGIFVLSDLAYAEVYFDDNPPPSVLQVPGAMDVAVEFTSMSKTYSMPGWRMGFAVGNERLIAALGAGEILSRLRRVHAGPGGGDRRAQRPGRLHPRDARDLQAPARRAGRELRPRRLGGAAAARLDVRLGADPGAVSRASAASSSPRCWSRRPRSRSRPASASASTAKATCASRWWRTSSASARPPATSAAFLKPAPKSCTTSSPSPSGAEPPPHRMADDVRWLPR